MYVHSIYMYYIYTSNIYWLPVEWTSWYLKWGIYREHLKGSDKEDRMQWVAHSSFFIEAKGVLYMYSNWGERSEPFLVESTAVLSVYISIYIYRYVFDVRPSGPRVAPRYTQT